MQADKITAEESVRRAIYASAPEKKAEFDDLWHRYNPVVDMAEDKIGFTLEAGAFGLVVFEHKTMCQIWLLGFAAQASLSIYSPYLLLSEGAQLPFSADVVSEEKDIAPLSDFVKQIFSKIEELRGLNYKSDFIWPDGIPAPEEGKPKDINDSMAFDLLCIAAAYCFLHEINHVFLSKTNQGMSKQQEEHACDCFAREFLLGSINEYSASSGYDLDFLKSKRSMAIALASVLLFVITPEERWAVSEYHPPIVDRIRALANYSDLPKNDRCWVYLSCLLLSIMTYRGINAGQSHVNSQKEYCLYLLASVESHLTIRSSRRP